VILTAPLFPVPAFTMVDFNLVRDLNLRMTEMQCSKFFYGGQKLRILGKVSTTVQCIVDGAPAGTLHLKAHVVQDLYKLFDVHSIAGTKLSHKLIGPPAKPFPDTEISAEPTDDAVSDAQDEAKKKKRKRKKKPSLSQATIATNSLSPTKSRSLSESSSDDRPTPPPSVSQGRWARHYSYDGWHPDHGYGRPDVLRCYYEDTDTRRVQNEMPDSWDDSDNDTDEYGDIYTNLSSVRCNDIGPSDPVSNVDHAVTPTLAQADTTTYSHRLLSIARTAWIAKLNTGQDIPTHLQHIPVPHGADWCSRDCAAALYDGDLPAPLCGYNPANLPENFYACSNSCSGRWCSCLRRYPGMDFMS